MHRDPLFHTGHLIRRAQQLHVALWNREVSTRVSSVQYAALVILDEQPGLSQRELGAELDLDRSTIADIVERMATRGVLERSQSTEDRRRKVLTLTPAGAAELAELSPLVARVDELITGDLGDGDRNTLRSLLREVLEQGIARGVLSGRIPQDHHSVAE